MQLLNLISPLCHKVLLELKRTDNTQLTQFVILFRMPFPGTVLNLIPLSENHLNNHFFKYGISAFDTWLATDVHKPNVPIKYCKPTLKKNDDGEITKRVFKCFRSGYFKEAVERKRRLKSQGSCKMNGHCTSEIVRYFSFL